MRGVRLTRFHQPVPAVLVAVVLAVLVTGILIAHRALPAFADSSAAAAAPGTIVSLFPVHDVLEPATVPDEPFEEPAAPAKEVPEVVLSGTTRGGIPTAAMRAYRNAAERLDRLDPSCGLPWYLLAAIGSIESDHGRAQGNHVTADGVSSPGIIGIALDGRPGVAVIRDSDRGKLDHDTTYDRAVGPMQFIPGTWRSVAADGDGDGVKNPQDIDDAALAAGIYLCAGPGNLSTDAGAARAAKRYNQSDSYVRAVLARASAYGGGAYSVVANHANARGGKPWLQPALGPAKDKPKKPAPTKPTPTPDGDESDGDDQADAEGSESTPPTPAPTQSTPAPTPTPQPVSVDTDGDGEISTAEARAACERDGREGAALESCSDALVGRPPGTPLP